MIRIESLCHAFGNETVLHDLDFEIIAGERVVLLGGNGSGKSTLLKLLDGLIAPRSGRILYEGVPLESSRLRDLDFRRRFRREVVLLFQNPNTMLFNPTVFDEIAFGPRQLGLNDLDSRVRHWAGVFGLTECLDRSPFQLSGGEKQKLCLASLLIMNPRLLLLDEPYANLDARSTGWLVDFLQDLDVTSLVTTHNLSLAPEFGTRALVLSERHQLIYDGSCEELLDDADILREANLTHRHRHRHDGREHSHHHTHDWR